METIRSNQLIFKKKKSPCTNYLSWRKHIEHKVALDMPASEV